jgi:aspartyl-tRNA(Asn)/glutamyl-tRNA(Gln) amidotransferase subunit A
MQELITLSIIEALKKLQKKEFSTSELIEAHIKQAVKTKHLNSYITENFTEARIKAKLSDKYYMQGTARKLEGIPIGIKDIFCTKGIKTTAASKMLSNFIPTYESTISNRIANFGSIMMGKTNMDEFAMGSSTTTSYFGPTINPWKKKDSKNNLVPGGSSGGSASAVSSMSVMAALGSDTGGSIRQPAAFTGTFGVKPTYGRCSRWGMIAFASSLDQAGIITRSVSDAALILESIMGFDKKDSTSINKTVPELLSACTKSIKGMKIGIPTNLIDTNHINKDVLQTWENSIQIMRADGAKIISINLPNIKYALSTYYVIAPAEASSNLSRYDGVRYGYRTIKTCSTLDEMYKQTRTEGFGEEVKRRIMIGAYVLSSKHIEAYYLKAQKIRRLISNDFMQAYNTVDIILLPSTPTTAFELDYNKNDPLNMYLNDIFTIPASLAGLPCASVPSSISNNGLPLGIQLIAPYLDEYNLFRAASVIERATNHINFLPQNF